MVFRPMWRKSAPHILALMNARIVGLLLLSAIPLFGGLARVAGLVTGHDTLEGHERFAADPLPALLHIIGATGFFTVGALQFIPALRRTRWHRLSGRVLAGLGVLAALSGIWMALTWPPKEFDGPPVNAVRITVALAMVFFLVQSVLAARERDFVAHERWIVRAYALFAGAGTQVFTLGIFFFPALAPLRGPEVYAVAMGAGWALNAVIAELSLRPIRTEVLS